MLRPSTSSRRSKRPRLTSWLAILLLSFVGSTGSAAEPDVAVLAKGEPAPYAGVLMPTTRAIRFGQKFERCEAEKAAQIERLQQLAKIDLDAQKAITKLERESSKLRESLLRDELGSVGAWYRSPWFVSIVTVAGTYGILRAAKGLP